MIRLVSATGSFAREYGSAQSNAGDSRFHDGRDIFQSNSPDGDDGQMDICLVHLLNMER